MPLKDWSVVAPIPLESLPETLQVKIAEACSSGVLSTPLPVQIWAHRPKLATLWLSLLSGFHQDSSLDTRTRELMRLKIAAGTNCNTCQIARKTNTVSEEDIACLSTEDESFTEAERAAMTYAQMFATDFQAIGQTELNTLHVHYTGQQIVEIQMYCALMLAGGRMTYVQTQSFI